MHALHRVDRCFCKEITIHKFRVHQPPPATGHTATHHRAARTVFLAAVKSTDASALPRRPSARPGSTAGTRSQCSRPRQYHRAAGNCDPAFGDDKNLETRKQTNVSQASSLTSHMQMGQPTLAPTYLICVAYSLGIVSPMSTSPRWAFPAT